MYGKFNLERSRFEHIKKTMGGFDSNQIYAFKQILSFISPNKISQQEVVNYINDVTMSVKLSYQIVKELLKLKPFTKKCSDCGSQTKLITVNDSACSMVGGNYKTMFYCSDELGCGYEFYSDESYESMMNRRIEAAGLSEAKDRLEHMRRHHSVPSDGGKPDIDKSKCGGCGKG